MDAGVRRGRATSLCFGDNADHHDCDRSCHCGTHSDGHAAGNSKSSARRTSARCGSRIYGFGHVQRRSLNRLRRRFVATNTGFLAALHQNAVSARVTNLAGALDAEDLHLSVSVKYYGHVCADDAGNPDGSADLKVGIRLHELGRLGADAPVIQIQVGLLLRGIMLRNGQVGIRADAQNRAVIQGDARARQMPGINNIAPKYLLGS